MLDMTIDNPWGAQLASGSPRLGASFQGVFRHVVFAADQVIDDHTPQKVTKSATKKIKAGAMCDVLRPSADNQAHGVDMASCRRHVCHHRMRPHW
jgi:hypothetical protein